jgi:hypothetical protein
VTVTDRQVSVLRALLAGDFEQHRTLRAQLHQEADREGYSALIAAAFFEAADRRFTPDHSRETIVQFVASARARSDDAARQIDPLLAERMIRGVFEDAADDGHSGQELVETQVLLLAAIVSEAAFTDSDLDSFLAAGRKLADRWTG